MEFSNRCKEYKERLLQVMNTTKDLEAEIKFLDDQIAFAAKSNVKLKNQLNRIPTQ
jgi:predicted RNase H-like nuclease (RuvC/YqgF family)